MTATIFKETDIDIPFFIDSSMAMLIFYHLGKCFNKYKIYEKRLSVGISILILLLYSFFIAYVQPSVNIKDNIFPYYLPLLSIAPIISLYQISCRIKSKCLMLCGASSLTIMGLHHPVFDVAMFPIVNRLPLPHACQVVLMVGTTLLMVLLIDKILNKYTPFLLGKF